MTDEEEMKCNLCIMHRCSECKCPKMAKQLEKENAKLRERLNSVNQTNNYYEEKERYALAEHNENIQLKAQIEKMKNCQNCKHDRYGICISEIRCENFEQWELAE